MLAKQVFVELRVAVIFVLLSTSLLWILVHLMRCFLFFRHANIMIFNSLDLDIIIFLCIVIGCNLQADSGMLKQD